LGQGSRFTVRLPRSRKAVPAPPPASVAAKGAARRILVVEDNIDACDTLAGFLGAEGHTVRCVHDGRDGLAAALEETWDVIICDIGLPGLDGFDLVRSVRAAGGGMHPCAIALSGYGQDEDRERGLEAGFAHYLVKPVSAGSLRVLIAELP
jgi:DNA-binding response OmpR family regulator